MNGERVSETVIGEPLTAMTVGNSATAHTWVRAPEDDAIPNARRSIACEVSPEGELVLRPMDALGAYFLDNFWRGEIRGTWVGRPMSANDSAAASRDVDAPQKGLREIRLKVTHGSVLSRGGNPLYTGVHVHPDDYAEARAFVDALRDKRARASRKAHPRKNRATPPKANTKRKRKAGRQS